MRWYRSRRFIYSKERDGVPYGIWSQTHESSQNKDSVNAGAGNDPRAKVKKTHADPHGPVDPM